MPLNILRLAQMMKLVRRVRSASQGDHTMDWLKPYMTRRHCSSGQFLFRKGDIADTMFYIASGCFRIPELGIQKMPGELVGWASVCWRQTVGARSQWNASNTANLLAIRYDQVHELFFQNPDFGFYFMQLAAARLFNVVKLQEQALGKRKAEAVVYGI